MNESYAERAVWRSENKQAFFFKYMFVFSLFILLSGIFNRYFVSFIITNGLVLLLEVFNYYKYSFLEDFLYPWI